LALVVIVVISLFLLLAACGDDDKDSGDKDQPQATATSENTGVIVLAEISDDPQKVINRTQPFADYLAANLGAFGIGAGEVKVVPDMETLATLLESGEADIAYDSLYPAMVLRNEAGAVPILRRWKDGVEEYHSVFFVLAESGIESLEDLNGKIIAFDEPSSTSGYVVPLDYLLEAGLNPVEKPSVEAAVAEDEIGFVFSNDDENTIQWVASQRVAAGVVDNTTFDEIPDEVKANLVILAETGAFPRQVVLVRSGMDPALQAAIIAVLIGMDETETGRAALDEFSDTAQFDEFPQGADAALTDMQAMYDRVQSRD
jgi:phosphonate transport system substrate-binding protein